MRMHFALFYADKICVRIDVLAELARHHTGIKDTDKALKAQRL